MPRPTTAADATPVRVVIVTLDSHLGGSLARAWSMLKRDYPGIVLSMHAASDWAEDPAALEKARAEIARGDIILATMLFMEEHINAVFPALKARRETCDAIVGCMSAGEVVRLTKVGRFRMGEAGSSSLAFLKRLRGKSGGESSGAEQLKMLKRLPKILRFIPGTAQDVRAYFLTLQYWLAGSEHNVANMVRMLIDRYADGPRKGLRGRAKYELPAEYPDTGLYHPALAERVTDRIEKLPRPKNARATVGMLLMRSYILAGNTAHYDGVIAALEARGIAVIPAFASGLDARPAAQAYFFRGGRPAIDALVSLTGFSLVGGPAYNDARAAEDMLAALDVPCIAATALEFQTIEQWQGSDRGLSPVEATMMVAIPELDGSIGSMVFGGRSDADTDDGRDLKDMRPEANRADMLAERVARLVALRRAGVAERRVAIVLFNFPPNAGAIGTAAYLSVFESLFNTLTAMKAAGYAIDMPDTVDALREAIIDGNGARYGQNANVAAHIPAADHVKRERHLAEIEAQWGPAPGKHNSDGRGIFVLGCQFGNVLVGIQPSFGYEGDPMRLLFEKGFSPTHAFSAFYRYIDQDFGAHAVVHFGTHGALEFMPGKQSGMSGACWPDRLIGALPNVYLYAANNPSEGTIAKRRSSAALVSYLTPPVSHAGLYRGLIDLKATIERWRALDPLSVGERGRLAEAIQAQASVLDLAAADPAWTGDASAEIGKLANQVLELEYTLIPHGLHVVGGAMNEEERADLLVALADASHGVTLERPVAEAIAAGASPERLRTAQGKAALDLKLLEDLAKADRLLSEDHEILGLLRALDGRYIRPAPGGDLLRTPAILPTGRNLHGFDPFRIPSSFAAADGARQTERLLARHQADGHGLPRSVAVVLWGTDNLKTEGGPIAQVLALIGARARFDGYGRLAGADLIPLAELGRPRIDVVVTVSGIFRDLLPLQMKLLAEACYLAASAEEPPEQNFVRAHALAYAQQHGCDLETASLRVFSNADGAYGSNVSHMIDSGRWDDENELAETWSRRKSFAYGRNGRPAKQADLLQSMLSGVELTYQNLDSVELGITSIDHYFDTLGGITRSVMRASGQEQVPVYIGDQTRGAGQIRTLGEQVALETRTRMLNPKWYEGMLKHGYEGVRQIEAHVTNTMGWSATTGEVAHWVYAQLSQTYVLDPEMRKRLAELNPHASARVANRLIEAHERKYWTPDDKTLAALREAGEELEDRLEGVAVGAAA